MKTEAKTEDDKPALADAAGSAEAKIVERRMVVGLTAPGFNGRFELPEKNFNDLLAWLAERSCGQEKQPNARTELPARITPVAHNNPKI